MITEAELAALEVIFQATIRYHDEDRGLVSIDGDFVSLVSPDGQSRQEWGSMAPDPDERVSRRPPSRRDIDYTRLVGNWKICCKRNRYCPPTCHTKPRLSPPSAPSASDVLTQTAPFAIVRAGDIAVPDHRDVHVPALRLSRRGRSRAEIVARRYDPHRAVA